jgi:hypothetical protein
VFGCSGHTLGLCGAQLVMCLVDAVDTTVDECGAHLVKCLVDVVNTLMWCPPGHRSG